MRARPLPIYDGEDAPNLYSRCKSCASFEVKPNGHGFGTCADSTPMSRLLPDRMGPDGYLPVVQVHELFCCIWYSPKAGA